MDRQNRGRFRSNSAPPLGRVRAPEHPFNSVARRGLIPGGGANGIHSADPQAYARATCVQRMRARPSQHHLDDAMKNPARGILAVTSERPNSPLPRELRPEANLSRRATQLTPEGQATAERRMANSMLVSSHPPADDDVPDGVAERFRQQIPPRDFTSILVPKSSYLRVRPLFPHTPVFPVPDEGKFDNVKLGWSDTGQSYTAPDYRQEMRYMTRNRPQDFHAVRADLPPPGPEKPRQRGKSAPAIMKR